MVLLALSIGLGALASPVGVLAQTVGVASGVCIVAWRVASLCLWARTRVLVDPNMITIRHGAFRTTRILRRRVTAAHAVDSGAIGILIAVPILETGRLDAHLVIECDSKRMEFRSLFGPTHVVRELADHIDRWQAGTWPYIDHRVPEEPVRTLRVPRHQRPRSSRSHATLRRARR